VALKLYLAGPDVFLREAVEIGRRKKALCRDNGHEGLFPLDNDVSPDDAAAIFAANRGLMDRADAGLFNLSPFRGPSADAGTVFELGYMARKASRCSAIRTRPPPMRPASRWTPTRSSVSVWPTIS
jgi:nucleoside 2-deoxyribosyltransferase